MKSSRAIGRALKTVLFALLPLMLMLAACGSSSETPEPHTHSESDADGVPIVHVGARYASGLAADLDTLLASTDASFVGEVIGTSGQHSLEFRDTGRGIPITTYLVRVEESNGEPAVGSTVEVDQMGGLTQAADGNTVRVVLEFDSPMMTGERYLFIANEDGGKYTASAFARFLIENDRVTVSESWDETGASIELTGSTVSEAMEKVSNSGH